MKKKMFFTGLVLLLFFMANRVFMLSLFPIFLMIASTDVLQKINKKLPGSLMFKVGFWGMWSGILTEVLAILNNQNLPDAQKALFHADPAINIFIGLGYYIPLALAWYFLFKKYDYKVKDVFLISGFSGFLLEQHGAVFFSFNPALWVYAFFVHASIIAIPFVILKDELTAYDKQKSGFKKYFLGFVIPALVASLSVWLWMSIFGFQANS